MFRCKGTDEQIRMVGMRHLNNGWVPAITFCIDNLYVPPNIPTVKDLNLEINEEGFTATWTPSDIYMTEFQYKIGDGEWVTLLIEAGNGAI